MMAGRFQPDHESNELDEVIGVAADELIALRDTALRAAEAIAAAGELPMPGDDEAEAEPSARSRPQRLAAAVVDRTELIAASCDRMLTRLDQVHPGISVSQATGAKPSAGEGADPPSDGVRLLVMQMRAAGEDPETIEESLRRLDVPNAGRAVYDVFD